MSKARPFGINDVTKESLWFRQAIATRYLGPTDRRGSRVVAQAQAGRIVLNWDDALNSPDNHWRAAMEFALRWGWYDKTPGRWVGGGMPDGSYVFVFAETDVAK